MWAGRYVCRRAQKARPSLQLLLKLVTSIFWVKERNKEREREKRERECMSKRNKETCRNIMLKMSS